MVSRAPPPDAVRTAEVIGSLCHATDLAMGFPLEHGLRSTLLGMSVAARLGLDEDELRRTYYGSLLFYAGCTADADVAATLFPPGALLEHFTPAMFGSPGEIAGGFVALHRDWVDAHPEQARVFVEQSARALDYAREHPEETRAIFAAALAERGENPEVAQYFRGYGVREGGLPVLRDIQFWIDVFEREGQIPAGKLVAADLLLVTGDDEQVTN